MMKLNLTAKGREQELILAYLQENASETLAEKINNGVVIEHKGKRVLNKKTLDGFMQYAADEAKKLAEKGARSACVEDATVYGWAIHYFEEDSIIGKLYTLDGKELTEPKKTTPATVTPTRPVQKQDAQMSLFGMMAENAPTMSEPDDEESDRDDEDESDEDDSETEESDEETDDGNEPDEETEDEAEPEEADEGSVEEEPEGQGTPFYQCYKKFSAKYHDAVLFMRLGDFYEALGDHAIKVSDAIGLTLTGRDCGLKSRVPMCGVPYHAFEVYVAKLLERGFYVAVSENLTGFHFMSTPTQRIDEETGEVLPDTKEQTEEDPLDGYDTSAFDKEALCILSELFGDDIDVR